MFVAKASFQTETASRYLQQLCKHFAHKVETRHDETSGWVDFRIGEAELSASSERLDFTARSDAAEGLQQTKDVLESHIIRFAFREKLDRLDWSD